MRSLKGLVATTHTTKESVAHIQQGNDDRQMTEGFCTELLAASKSLTVLRKAGRLYVNDQPTDVHKVVTADVNDSTQTVVVATADKHVIVLKFADGASAPKETARHTIDKRPTSVSISTNGETILVSDAFGNVHSLLRGVSDKDSDSTSPNPNTQVIVGHFSSITHMTLTATQLVTCDRDGRIRISDWPLCFVIRAFCLGHSDVVTVTRALPQTARLLSGSADGSLSLWRADGTRLCALDVREQLPSRAVIMVTDVVVTRLHPDIALFVLHDCARVFSVAGLSGDTLLHPRVVYECKDVVTGIALDAHGLLTVSVRGGDGVLRGDLTLGDNGLVRVDCMEVAFGGPLQDGTEEVADATPLLGRFDWLMQQRKKEMVEDWKGKKRRHLEI